MWQSNWDVNDVKELLQIRGSGECKDSKVFCIVWIVYKNEFVITCIAIAEKSMHLIEKLYIIMSRQWYGRMLKVDKRQKVLGVQYGSIEMFKVKWNMFFFLQLVIFQLVIEFNLTNFNP